MYNPHQRKPYKYVSK